MPVMNGFDFLNRASEWNFDVIFTTAYDQYAIKAIRFSALDYLLKPIDIVDLQNAVNRHIVKRQNPTVSSQQPLVDNLIYNLQQKDQQQFKLALSTSEEPSALTTTNSSPIRKRAMSKSWIIMSRNRPPELFT